MGAKRKAKVGIRHQRLPWSNRMGSPQLMARISPACHFPGSVFGSQRSP